jgi:hypothetical protein
MPPVGQTSAGREPLSARQAPHAATWPPPTRLVAPAQRPGLLTAQQRGQLVAPAGQYGPLAAPAPEQATTPTQARKRPGILSGNRRIAAIAAAATLLLAILLSTLAISANAATSGITSTGANNGGVSTAGLGSGVGIPTTHHQVASRPTGSSGALVFGGICLAIIVATATGVLMYTVRTRRTLDPDHPVAS